MSARSILCDCLGQTIAFNADGWINAPVAAARFDKAPNEWLDLDSTEAPTRSCRCQACASPL
ncbi:Phage protein [Pseudomonas chlororaphis subsp. aureofaciens]|uniref:Phage protein n=1 Tax=Pseudomonas chlororaphis subsp. aureofaciens TaxID=587851 RepID=A0AAD0ZMZ9_9PSED|nr:Phage protein [Pseudomonas chlororaphis subsp. aureofaciens]AZE32054.1 Phage protein [Pseudomonas chlororaphis subsp. aureofaciens]